MIHTLRLQRRLVNLIQVPYNFPQLALGTPGNFGRDCVLAPSPYHFIHVRMQFKLSCVTGRDLSVCLLRFTILLDAGGMWVLSSVDAADLESGKSGLHLVVVLELFCVKLPILILFCPAGAPTSSHPVCSSCVFRIQCAFLLDMSLCCTYFLFHSRTDRHTVFYAECV